MAYQKKKKMSAGIIIWWLIAACLTIAAACGILHMVFTADTGGQNGDAPAEIAGIAVHTDYIPTDTPARSGTVRQIKYVVIHETDNTGANATAKSHNEYIHQNCYVEKKSWHYTVDDTEIWHHLPDNEMGYHAGDSGTGGDGNRCGIGVELCVNAGGDFDQTMRNAAQLTAYLLLKYDLTLDAVKKHQDFSGKDCPQTILAQNRWEEFLAMVQTAYDEQAAQQAVAGSV